MSTCLIFFLYDQRRVPPHSKRAHSATKIKAKNTINKYTTSTMQCMTVSLSHGGEGLGAMWGEEKTGEYLEKAAFKSIETYQLAHDVQNNWYLIRK